MSDQLNVIVCEWCRRRVVGLSGRPPTLSRVTAINDVTHSWAICPSCRTQLGRLIGRMGRPKGWGQTA